MRTVTNVHKFMTIEDLRTYLDSPEVKALNQNAFIWIPQGDAAWAIDCLTHADIGDVSTPDDGYPTEKGICLYSKKVVNKVQD
jgi:hypothetical protein